MYATALCLVHGEPYPCIGVLGFINNRNLGLLSMAVCVIELVCGRRDVEEVGREAGEGHAPLECRDVYSNPFIACIK